MPLLMSTLLISKNIIGNVMTGTVISYQLKNKDN